MHFGWGSLEGLSRKDQQSNPIKVSFQLGCMELVEEPSPSKATPIWNTPSETSGGHYFASMLPPFSTETLKMFEAETQFLKRNYCSQLLCFQSNTINLNFFAGQMQWPHQVCLGGFSAEPNPIYLCNENTPIPRKCLLPTVFFFGLQGRGSLASLNAFSGTSEEMSTTAVSRSEPITTLCSSKSGAGRLPQRDLHTPGLPESTSSALFRLCSHLQSDLSIRWRVIGEEASQPSWRVSGLPGWEYHHPRDSGGGCWLQLVQRASEIGKEVGKVKGMAEFAFRRTPLVCLSLVSVCKLPHWNEVHSLGEGGEL